jgi:hypothetical protein
LVECWVDDLMVEWGKTIAVLVACLVVTATVHADMMSVSVLDTVCRQASPVDARTDLQQANSPSPSFGCAGAFALSFGSVDFLPEASADVTQTCETQPLQVLAGGPGSLNLCLYALLGLGLCRSAPLVKKLHLGCIPDWYHSDGPFQIGHSFAISPDCLCSAPVYCFIQPDGTVEDCLPQYYRGTIASLARKSQFAPTGLASRGPPCMS